MVGLYIFLYKLISLRLNIRFLQQKTLLLFICIIGLSACTTPSEKFHSFAISKQFNSSPISTPLFQHIIYQNLASNTQRSETLHIYLDGDGTPWVNNRYIAVDPTARSPMILDLMSMDKGAAILLGRPCYYGLHTSTHCHFQFWTSHRYAEKVVASMAQALSLWLLQHPHFNKITFIGYSGGGTLALLLAPYFKQTEQVVTIAANLDTDAWAKLHDYSSLSGSLNPIKQPRLPATVRQLHIAGDQDTNVPASIIKSYVTSDGTAKFLTINNQAHCCWKMQWLAILAILENNDI